jgi:DNA gyrase subunit A
MVENIGTVRPININEEMRGSFLDYAMSVIVARALPDARDGLKPVHRRILYAMYDMGIRANSAYKKSARIVGEVLGKYHPHGDASVYDAMARMAQDFSMRYPLVDGQGNFGSVDGDSPAAMRYTEARLAQLAEEILSDIDMDTVDFGENFDGTLREPLVLPARLPNMLLNGTSGIAVGMATNIPPHNLSELAQAVAWLIDEWERLEEITVDDLMQFVKGPDFPTGAAIIATDDLREAYATGRGRVIVRARIENEIFNGRQRLIVTEIPYQISKTAIIERIVALVREGRIQHISDLRDESDRNGMRLVIELKAGAQPAKVMNQLYKHSQLQSTFGIQMLALVNNEPRTLSLKRMLTIYIEHRYEVIERRTRFELGKRQARAHILEGLLRALDSIDAIIQTIRSADDTESARFGLMTRFDLSEAQANAILDMQLRRLAALERQKLTDEYNEVMARIAYLQDLLASPNKIRALIREDITEAAAQYNAPRRTRVEYGTRTDFDELDFIPVEEVVVLLTGQGYIKRVPVSAYRAQRRGGRGVIGMTTRDEDGVVRLLSANSHDTLLFFTDRGRVYSTPCHVVPEAGRAAKGTLVHAFLDLSSDEKITAIVPVDHDSFDEEGYFVMATRRGRIKRVLLAEFASVKGSGKIAMTLEEGDTLDWVERSNGTQYIVMATSDGQSIRFHEDRVRVLGRTAQGVGSMRLEEGDVIAGMDVLSDDDTHVLVVSRNGYGKRTELNEYRITGRKGKGVRTLSRNDKTGPIVAMRCINPKDDVVAITSSNSIIRVNLEQVRDVGRNTMGGRLVRLTNGDSVVSLTIVEGAASEDELTETEEIAAALGTSELNAVDDATESEEAEVMLEMIEGDLPDDQVSDAV